MPNPASLETGWWGLFQNKEENSGNIDRLIESLNTLKEQLEQENHPLIILQIERIVLAAERLQKKRAEEIGYKPLHPLYLSSYTLSEWLKAAEQMRALEKKEADLQKERQIIRQRTDYLRSELDELHLEYPLLKEESIEKLAAGLEIMSLRFQIEFNELEIQRIQKISNLIADNLSKLEKEKEIAKKRLDFSTLDKEALLTGIEKGKAALVEANRRLLEAEKEEAPALSTISAKISVNRAKMQILLNKIKLLVYQIEYEQEKGEPKEKLMELSSSLSLISSSTGQIKKELEQLPAGTEMEESLSDLEENIENGRLLIAFLKDRIIEEETSLLQNTLNFLDKIFSSLAVLWSWLSIKLFRINDYAVTPWVLIRAVIIFIAALFFGSLIVRSLKKVRPLKHRLGRANIYILSRIVYYALIIVGFLIACYSLGFDLTNFVIIAGALGIGVGLGLQTVVNNFFSGLVVLFSKVLKVDDIIEIDNGYKGRVVSIKMQTTHIRTFEGKDVIIPNSDLMAKKLVNWTMADPYLRLHIPFGIEYGADKELVEKIVIDAAEKFPFTITDETICPKPKVWLVSLGDNALQMELVVWVNIRVHSSRGDMKADYLWDIERELMKRGIDIPYPHADIRLLDTSEIKIKKEK